MSLPAAQEQPVIIICGGGTMPFAVADAVIRRGRRVFLYALRGWADAEAVRRYEHEWGHVGQFGRFLRLARRIGGRDVVFIGTLLRPAIREIRLDFATLRLLPRIMRQFSGGDDRLISGIARIVEEHGFRLVGANEVAPEILIGEGAVTGRMPSADEQRDIACGLAVLRALGPYDIGQAVVVCDQHVLAVEAAEGTDQLLARVAELRRSGRVRTNGGVLVKAPKPGQDRRFDLPAIGPRTIEAAAAAGLGGIAVTAGSTLVAEPQVVATAASAANLFLVGVPEADH
jgi:DUF1009 family protein